MKPYTCPSDFFVVVVGRGVVVSAGGAVVGAAVVGAAVVGAAVVGAAVVGAAVVVAAAAASLSVKQVPQHSFPMVESLH